MGVGEAGGSEREANGGGGRCIRSPRWSPSHVLRMFLSIVPFLYSYQAHGGGAGRDPSSRVIEKRTFCRRFKRTDSTPLVELPH